MATNSGIDFQHRVLLAAVAVGCGAPIDGVTTAFADPAALRSYLGHAWKLCFTAKLCIHPLQVEVVNLAFTPSAEQFDWVRAVIAADAGRAPSPSSTDI